MKDRRKASSWIGDLLLLLTAVAWGGGFVAVTKALETVTPFYLLAIRFGMAGLLMIVIFWKTIKTITKKDLVPGILCGIFFFVGYAFQTQSAMYISPGKLAFLSALNVIMVPFISAVCFKEKMHYYNILSCIIAVIGFGLLNLSGHEGITFGIGEFLGVMCAAMFAVQISMLGNCAKHCDVIKLSIVQVMTCAILGILCALVFEKLPTEFGIKVIMPLTYLGICSTFIGFLFQTIGQKYTSASRAVILLSMESVFGFALSILILKEQITVSMGIGAALILGAVILAEYMHARMEAREALHAKRQKAA